METLRVATLIEALALVGQVYRDKDGSQPAEAVREILAQLEGAGDLTLAEWVEAKRAQPGSEEKKQSEPGAEPVNLDHVLAQLENAATQVALRDAVASLSLDATEWKALCRQLTGRVAKSGKTAREAVETFLSDRLLLDERVESVKRQFRPATPPPGAS